MSVMLKISQKMNMQRVPFITTGIPGIWYVRRRPAIDCCRRSLSWMSQWTQWTVAVSQSSPVIAVQESLVQLHDITGLPWCSVIVLSTCLIRILVTFPLTIYQSRIFGRYVRLQSEIKGLAEQLKFETNLAIKKFGWTEKRAKFAYRKSMKRIIRDLIVRDNCHPFKASIVLWVQLPLWISMSFAIRNIVTPSLEGDPEVLRVFVALSDEGALWFHNLILPDSYLVLPILLGATNLLITKIYSLKARKVTWFRKGVTLIIYAVSLAMVPVAASVPSCLSLYWTTSSVLGLIQNLVLLSPRFCKSCGIPRDVDDSAHPYREIVENLKSTVMRRITK